MTQPRTAQRMLEMLVAADEHGTRVADLSEALGRASSQITTTALRLRRRGLIETGEAGRYRATDAGRAFIEAGRTVKSGQGTPRSRQKTRGLRERAWWLMRDAKRFTLPILLDTLAGEHDRSAGSNLGKYVRALEQCGVLRRMRRRVSGITLQSNGHVIWMLVRDLGRQAPVWRPRSKTLFDPNSGEVLESVEVADV